MDGREQRHDLDVRLIFGWGLGTLPVALYFNTFNALALRFLTDYVGIAAAVAGSLIAFSKIYDAVSDPVMGFISDKTRSSAGRRRPYILVGSLACALALWILFSLRPNADPQLTLLYAFGALILYATAYSIYNVPYLAMPAEISRRGVTRASLMSWRVFFIGVGALLAGTLGPKIVKWQGGGLEGHSFMAAVLGTLILLSGIATFLLTRRCPETILQSAPPKLSWREKLTTIVGNRPYTLLLSVKLFQLAAVAVSASTLAFFTVWVLGKDYSALGNIVLFTTLGQIIGTPIWLRIYRKIGARKTFLVSAACFAIASLTWLFANSTEPSIITYTRVFIKGVGTGGILLVGQALLPDVIEYDRLSNGQRREGVLSGLYTTVEKLAFALGTAFVGIWLQMMGYVSQRNPFSEEQSASALLAVQLCQSVFPAILITIAAIFILFFKLDEGKLEQLRKASAPSNKPGFADKA